MDKKSELLSLLRADQLLRIAKRFNDPDVRDRIERLALDFAGDSASAVARVRTGKRSRCAH
jgi:hypothetical protein